MLYKPTNQQIVEVLEGSLRYLSPTRFDHYGKHEYICWSMEKFEERKYCETTVSSYIMQNIIYPRLQGDCTMTRWLQKQGVPEKELKKEKGKFVQIHRRQWVEQLIKEFSS